MFQYGTCLVSTRPALRILRLLLYFWKICTPLDWNITAFRDEHITILRKCAASIFMLEGLLLWNDSLKTVSQSVRCIYNKNFDILTHCSWPSASRSFPYNGKAILHLSLPFFLWICGTVQKSEKNFLFNFLKYNNVECSFEVILQNKWGTGFNS